ncbi:MAG: hypothetical protein EBT66_09580 [Bacteroidetes bacterium]|nr:hypothetical protein [Bacteroidota bacterium]
MNQLDACSFAYAWKLDRRLSPLFGGIYLRPHEFKLSIAQPVYETSLLALPMIRNCDEMETKPCDEVMIQKLETLNSDSTEEPEVDARWEKLKQLKNL